MKNLLNTLPHLVLFLSLLGCQTDTNLQQINKEIAGIYVPKNIQWETQIVEGYAVVRASFCTLYLQENHDLTIIGTEVGTGTKHDSLGLGDAFFARIQHGKWFFNENGKVILKYRTVYSDIILPNETIPGKYETGESYPESLKFGEKRIEYIKTGRLDYRSRESIKEWSKFAVKIDTTD